MTIRLADIKRVVAKRHGIRPGALIGESREYAIARPRQIAMFLARKHTSCTLPCIGRDFGGRHHTTVLHAIQAVTDRMAASVEFRLSVENTERLLLTGYDGPMCGEWG